MVAKPLEGHCTKSVENQQEDQQEEDGAGVQHDALRSVELHRGLRIVLKSQTNGSKRFLAKQILIRVTGHVLRRFSHSRNN